MKKELPKVYEPQEVESRIYETWEKNGCFKGRRDPKRKPFTIVMPPPNVTGQLHMGHAMDSTLQDWSMCLSLQLKPEDQIVSHEKSSK